MPTPTPDDLKRRARAAWAYSMREQDEIATLAGINARTLQGLLGPTGSRAPSVEQAWRIAAACDVPADFIIDGWEWAGRDRSLHDRLADLERQVAALRDPTPPNGSTQRFADAFGPDSPSAPDAQPETDDANESPGEAA